MQRIFPTRAHVYYIMSCTGGFYSPKIKKEDAFAPPSQRHPPQVLQFPVHFLLCLPVEENISPE